MRSAIVKGELVYMLESPGHIYNNELRKYSEVQIIRHRDLIRMLNKLFKEVENMDTSEKAAVFGPGYFMFQVLNIFAGSYAGNYRIPIEIKDKEDFASEDPQKVKKKKMPKLLSWSNTSNMVIEKATKAIRQFKVYKGGLLQT